MDIFFAISDPRRREIVRLVAERGQLSAGDICKEFDITAQAVSQHLRVLRECGLLLVEKSAQKRIYHINTEPILELDKWARETASLWDKRFNQLDEVLDRQKNRMLKIRQSERNGKTKRA